MLTVLVVRGATLEGSLDGILYFIVPEWEKLASPDVILFLVFIIILFVSKKTRYRPVWQVTIAGLPQYPVWY